MIGLVMCLSLAFALATTFTPATKVGAEPYYTPATFEMLGMSVRYDAAAGEDGIRFGVKIDKDTYDALLADNNAVAGILVAPSDVLTSSSIAGTTLNLWNAEGSNARYGVLYNGASGTNLWTLSGDYATGTVYLHGLPSASYNRPITAVGYIDWDNDSNADKMNYSDTVEISMSDVALAVRADYEGSNTFGTTASNYAKLDSYLLNYDVKFIDAYGNVSTQNLKYGSTFEVPDAPAARTGYNFDGWLKKKSNGTYADSVTNFASFGTTVKYAMTFKQSFSTTGDTFEKPALGSSNPKYVADRANIKKEVSDGELTLRGGYYFEGATVDNGDDFMVQMTFTAVSDGEYVFMLTDDLESGEGRITFISNTFNFFNYDSGSYADKTWHWYDSIEARSNRTSSLTAGNVYTMTLVRKNARYTVLIDGNVAATFFDTESLQANYGSTLHVSDLVGYGDTLYLGIGSISHDVTVTDWRYSTDAETIAALVPDTFSKPDIGSSLYGFVGTTNTVADGTATLRGHYFFTDGTVVNGDDFMVQTTFTAQANAEYSFIITDDKSTGKGRIIYKVNDNNFQFYNYTSDTYDGHSWAWNDSWEGIGNSAYGMTAGKQYTMSMIHKGGKYTVYINGAKAVEFSETAKPKAWGTNASNISTTAELVGDGRTVYLGIGSYNATTVFTDWLYSTDPSVISAAETITTFKKPNINDTEDGHHRAVDKNLQDTSATAISAGTLTLRGAYYFDDAEVDNGSDYMIYMTFTAASNADMWFAISDDKTNGEGRIEYRLGNNKFYIYNYISGTYRDVAWHWYDAIEERTNSAGAITAGNTYTLVMVHKNAKYTVFINGVKAVEFLESEELTMYGSKSNPVKHVTDIVGAGEKVYLGIGSINATTTVSDWGYSTNPTAISQYVE